MEKSPKRKYNDGELVLPAIKMYYRPKQLKYMALIQEQTNPQNRRHNPKLNFNNCGNLIYDKGTTSNPLEKDELVSKWFCYN